MLVMEMYYIKEINKRFSMLNIIFSSIFISIIVYLIDYYNLPTILLDRYKTIVICIIILIISYMIKEFISKKIWNLINLETINYFDKVLLIGIFFEIVMGIYYYFNNIKYFNFIFILGIINILIIVIRFIKIKNLVNIMKKNKNQSNIYTISKLYNNEISNEKLVLLEEKELTKSKDDLLDVNIFVESIEDSLLQCKPNETFVISLIGKWGNGKTSVINLLKQKINSGGRSEEHTSELQSH